MKVKTLIKSVSSNENSLKSIEVYFGLQLDRNIILNIKDINNMLFSEKDLLDFIENNEEVNSFSYENQTLSISIK